MEKPEILNELDAEMGKLESELENFTDDLQNFMVKVRNFIKEDSSLTSEKWIHPLSNILDELDDMVTTLSEFGDTYDLF